MSVNVPNTTWLALALSSLVAVSGCCCAAIPLPGENQCPTDARRLYCSCGEEAVRRCPCGPGSEFYGLKPTCWREWPEGWQCNGCEGMPYVDHALCGQPVDEVVEDRETTPSPVEAPMKAETDLSNPFRSKPEAAEALPPLSPQVTPSAPAQKTPAPVIPPPPTPAAPAAHENVPAKTAPAKKAPAETAPSPNKATNQKSTNDATSVAAAQLDIPILSPPITPIHIEVPVPNLMPIAPMAMKMKASAPVLNAPLNAPAVDSATKPNPKPVLVAAAPKAKKKPVAKTTEFTTQKDRDNNPALSDRVEQHLINNLRL
jgi:hypothetical protein